MSTIKYARLEARIDKNIYELIKQAAQIKGVSLTTFVTTTARDVAIETINQAQILQLSSADQELFAQSLMTDYSPNEAMQKAFKNHNKLVNSHEKI